jgi:hypothetical protein
MAANCHIGERHVHAREILREDAWTEQLIDAVPDEKARHQQASERRQISFEIVRENGIVTTSDGDELLALSEPIYDVQLNLQPWPSRSNNSGG